METGAFIFLVVFAILGLLRRLEFGDSDEYREARPQKTSGRYESDNRQATYQSYRRYESAERTLSILGNFITALIVAVLSILIFAPHPFAF